MVCAVVGHVQLIQHVYLPKTGHLGHKHGKGALSLAVVRQVAELRGARLPAAGTRLKTWARGGWWTG